MSKVDCSKILQNKYKNSKQLYIYIYIKTSDILK